MCPPVPHGHWRYIDAAASGPFRGPLDRVSADEAMGRTILPPRMIFVVDDPEPRLEDVRVDLGRGEIRVPEHHLDQAQVRSALEQVRGEGMPQHVRAEISRHARLRAVRLEDLPEADARQRAA